MSRSDVLTALTIAGSDSSGGAGIQADLETFAAFGLHGTCAVTAVTAQNTSGVTVSAALSADLVTAQLEAVAGDIAIHATKIGMLATAAIVEAVAAAIDELELPLVVLDPVIASSSGERLLDDDGVLALANELLRRARVVTPNIAEAERLSGITIRSEENRRDAARRLHEMGAAAVIVTGGHSLEAFGPSAGDVVVDLLFDGRTFVELAAPRVSARGGHRVRGTGCTYASAVAAGLALGHSLADAAAEAQRYVAGGIEHARTVGRGAAIVNRSWRTPISR